MEFLDGSSTESEITEKVKIFKWPPTFSRPNSERILKDFIKSKPTEVSDTDGVSESEVNTLRLPAVVESLLVWKERKSDDDSIRLLFTTYHSIKLFSHSSYAKSRVIKNSEGQVSRN
jgi:hypothetical protein